MIAANVKGGTMLAVNTHTNVLASERHQYGNAIETHGLHKRFKDNHAVNGIDLVVPTGCVYGVLGPNGAGKTTLINMLATLMRPDAGEAKIFGYDVVRQAQQVRELIGLTGQFASVDESFTATENLLIFGRLLGLSRTDAKAKAKKLLAEFDLAEAANRPLSKFSGGMRRRLDLAASLIAQPPLIFLDEPTTGLDPRTRNQMWDTIRRLVRDGSTVLLTTQYLDEADQLADRIAVVDHGRIVAEDTPVGLKASVGQESLQITLKTPRYIDEALHTVQGVLQAKAHRVGATAINAPLVSADQITDVLVALRNEAICVAAVNVNKPTMDEVFLALTGAPAVVEDAISDASVGALPGEALSNETLGDEALAA
jgi:ABC-2 type transport system ATP-binding protein